jgi:hypothetical protein
LSGKISPPEGTPSAESFASLMMQAMEGMHKDMNIVPTADPDRDLCARSATALDGVRAVNS